MIHHYSNKQNLGATLCFYICTLVCCPWKQPLLVCAVLFKMNFGAYERQCPEQLPILIARHNPVLPPFSTPGIRPVAFPPSGFFRAERPCLSANIASDAWQSSLKSRVAPYASLINEKYIGDKSRAHWHKLTCVYRGKFRNNCCNLNRNMIHFPLVGKTMTR